MFVKFFCWVSRFTTRVLTSRTSGDHISPFTLEVTAADTLRSLELSWMGATSLDETLSLEMQSQSSFDGQPNELETEPDIEEEYLALTLLPEEDQSNDAVDQISDFPFTIVDQMNASLAKKENEVEHLKQVIKELVFSRARFSKASADIHDRYNQLQAEYFKACKVAQLARGIAQQNMQRNNHLQKQLKDTSDKMHKAHRQLEQTRQRNLDLTAENQQIKQQLIALERQQNWDNYPHSTFVREFSFTRLQSLI